MDGWVGGIIIYYYFLGNSGISQIVIPVKVSQ